MFDGPINLHPLSFSASWYQSMAHSLLDRLLNSSGAYKIYFAKFELFIQDYYDFLTF